MWQNFYNDRSNIYTDYIGKTIDVEAVKIRKLLSSLRPIDPRTVKAMKHLSQAM